MAQKTVTIYRHESGGWSIGDGVKTPEYFPEDMKLNVIKAFRLAVPGTGLKEAKDIVEQLPINKVQFFTVEMPEPGRFSLFAGSVDDGYRGFENFKGVFTLEDAGLEIIRNGYEWWQIVEDNRIIHRGGNSE